MAQAEVGDPPKRGGECALNDHALIPMLRHRRERAFKFFGIPHADDVKHDSVRGPTARAKVVLCTLCLFLLEAIPTFRASHVNPARG